MEAEDEHACPCTRCQGRRSAARPPHFHGWAPDLHVSAASQVAGPMNAPPEQDAAVRQSESADAGYARAPVTLLAPVATHWGPGIHADWRTGGAAIHPHMARVRGRAGAGGAAHARAAVTHLAPSAARPIRLGRVRAVPGSHIAGARGVALVAGSAGLGSSDAHPTHAHVVRALVPVVTRRTVVVARRLADRRAR